MRQVTKEEAERTEHLPCCSGYDGCDCFHGIWSHAEIYQLQFANFQMLHALMAIKVMAENPGYDMRDLDMAAIASEAIRERLKEATSPGWPTHKSDGA
jgi:hypothetical protein